MERQLDLSSVAARLRGRPVLACPSQSLVSRTSSRGSCVAVSTLARTLVLKFEMADRRDWGGGGDDLEESTQRMIERIWESLTDIQRRMDQQAPVPPVAVPPGDGETVPIVPVPPPPGVEVPFVAALPPPPPVLLAEEPVMQRAQARVSTGARHGPVIVWSAAMAGRTRRSSLPIQDEELSRTDGEQHEVPAPQGSLPPPLADYGTVMQGIVQAIQTQAQTQAAFQTQFEAQVPAPAQQDRGSGGVSVME
ncbi:hypothetical protein Taro_015727, partial [Colocasia esculenta]|nr:hypothetical protein [Colocasia esculenta]